MRSSLRCTPGDVLVGHSGGGFDATLAADAVPRTASATSPISRAALPTRRAHLSRSDGDARLRGRAEFDADVGEMLGYLKFDDDGAMWFADFDGAWKYFYHDCDEATARWAFERLGPERFGDTTVTPVSVPTASGRPTCPAASSAACRIGRCRAWLADTVTRRLGVEQLTIDTSHSPFLRAVRRSWPSYSCTPRKPLPKPISGSEAGARNTARSSRDRKGWHRCSRRRTVAA